MATRIRRWARWFADPLAVLQRVRRVEMSTGPWDVDVPECEVERTLVIASEVRTGSSLLCELLASTNRCGVPMEYLGPHSFERWESLHGVPRLGRAQVLLTWWRRVRLRRFWHRTWRYEPAEIRRYLDEVMSRRTTSNGVFAVNVHWHQWLEMRALGFDESIFRGEVTWVHLWRDDVVAQAVSALRALQTNRWRSDEGSARRTEAPLFDEPELDRLVGKAVGGRDGWKRFFAERGIEPLELTYEGLIAEREASVGAVLGAVGIEGGPEALAPHVSSRLERQADDVNARWVERYRAEHPDLA